MSERVDQIPIELPPKDSGLGTSYVYFPCSWKMAEVSQTRLGGNPLSNTCLQYSILPVPNTARLLHWHWHTHLRLRLFRSSGAVQGAIDILSRVSLFHMDPRDMFRRYRLDSVHVTSKASQFHQSSPTCLCPRGNMPRVHGTSPVTFTLAMADNTPLFFGSKGQTARSHAISSPCRTKS